MPKYNLLWDTWKKNGPPVYMAVAGYLGLMDKDVEPGKSPATSDKEDNNLFDLLGMAGPGGMF